MTTTPADQDERLAAEVCPALGTRLLADGQPSWPDEVHALLEELWTAVPEAAPRDCTSFTTARAEVAANIVEHAAREATVPVRLVAQCADAELRALCEDQGAACTGSGSLGDEHAESGRGLGTARALTDELLSERDGPVDRRLVVPHCSRS